MIAFLDLHGCSLRIDIFRFLRSWWWMHPWWSNPFGATLQLKKLAKKVKSIWRCWNPGSTVWQESPQNKGGEFLNEKTCIYIFCGCLGRKFIWNFCRCFSNIINIHIFWLRLRGIVYPLLPPATQRKFRFLSADEAVCTVQARVTMTQLDQIWQGKNGCENFRQNLHRFGFLGEGFRNDFLETSIQNMASIVVERWDAFKGCPPFFLWPSQELQGSNSALTLQQVMQDNRGHRTPPKPCIPSVLGGKLHVC